MLKTITDESIVTLWAGAGQCIAPLHYDPFENVFLQLVGSKRFVLLPPKHHNNVYLFPKIHAGHRRAQVNLNALDTLSFPKSKQLYNQALEIVVHAGDMLVLPSYWLHQVETLSNHSVSINVFTPSIQTQHAITAWEAPLVPPDIAMDQVALSMLHTLQALQTATGGVMEILLDRRYRSVLYRDDYSPNMYLANPHGDLHITQHMQEMQQHSHECVIQPHCNDGVTVKKLCEAFRASPTPPKHSIKVAKELMMKFQSIPNTHIRQTLIQDFVEDLAAQLVGDHQAYHLLNLCFSSSSSSS